METVAGGSDKDSRSGMSKYGSEETVEELKNTVEKMSDSGRKIM
jgi:hypothetical protein